MASSFPIQGEILEGFARAIHAFLNQFFIGENKTITLPGGNTLEVPDNVDIVFGRQRLDAGQSVIAFLGERVSTGKKVKCNPLDSSRPYGYERWDTIHKTVYVKVSRQAGEEDAGGEKNKNFREAIRIWDALISVFDIYAPQWFKDKNMRNFEISSSPIDGSDKNHVILVGTFQCKVEVRHDTAASILISQPSDSIFWLRPELLSKYTDGQQVNDWRDSSNNGFDLHRDYEDGFLMDGAPYAVANALNGYTVASFQEDENRLVRAEQLTSSPVGTLAMVIRFPAMGGGVRRMLCQGSDSLDRFVIQANGNPTDIRIETPSDNEDFNPEPLPAVDTWISLILQTDEVGDRVLAFMNGLVTTYIWDGGSRVWLGDYGGAAKGTYFGLGMQVTGTGGTISLQQGNSRIDVAELQIWDRELSLSELTQWGNYAAEKFGITFDV